MKKENEVQTVSCRQCQGSGKVLKVFSFAAITSEAVCPVCDGYGFVIKAGANQ